MIAEERLAICLQCPHLIKATHQCKKCGCIMDAKTKLPNASCPIGKWDQFNPTEEAQKKEDDGYVI
jgi:hypothetical protein